MNHFNFRDIVLVGMNFQIVLLCFITSFTTSSQVQNTYPSNYSRNLISHIPHQIHENSLDFSVNISPSTLPKWSNWSNWSKCRKCVQKRMRICINESCDITKLYQERHCKIRRCKRRRKHQENFHVMMPEKRFTTKTGDRTIWGPWSSWSMCNQKCRTVRKRYCKKPGRCKKKRQVQSAYCYHGESKCEVLVFNLMKLEDRHNIARNKYSYNKATRKRRIKKSTRCGMQFKKARMLKIIGGSESPRYKWPWHVALINQYAEVFCGGTLIAPEWVLTASHCVRSFLIVRLNEHDLKYADGRELELIVYKIFQHPQFDQRTVNGDIALLQLPMPVKTPVACLPNRKPTPHQLCSVMGWGKMKTNAKHGVSRLRETQVPMVDNEICKWAYRDLIITDNMICAGWASGKADTCAGDSGGGLMCPHKRTRNGRISYSVQGITSFGKGCGKRNKYGIYTVVYNYLDWIEYIINKY